MANEIKSLGLTTINDLPTFRPQPRAIYYFAWDRKSEESLEGRKKLYRDRPCMHKDIMMVTTEAASNMVRIYQQLTTCLYKKCSLIEFNRIEPALLRISNHCLINLNFIQGISKECDYIWIGDGEVEYEMPVGREYRHLIRELSNNRDVWI